MAQKILNNETYTQLNTVTDNYLFQNIGGAAVLVVYSDTQPADNAACDFVLEVGDGISSNEVTGTAWAKSTTPKGLIGLKEG